jgi:hypothetical protein
MSCRNAASRWAALAIAALVLAGCANTPDDESAFLPDPSLGEQAAPLPHKQAQRVVRATVERDRREDRDRDRKRGRRRQRSDEPTPEPSGGLYRDPDDPQTDEPTPDANEEPREGTRKRDRDRDGGGRGDDGDGGDGDGDGGGDGGGRGGDGGGSDGDGGKDRPPASPTPKPEPRYDVAANATDEEGDTSRDAPRYADSRGFLVESDGSNVRVTVAFAGRLPSVLGAEEVQGVGVDFFRSDERESDYQLFADGGNDGWTAYLDTPDGFVQYPGTFAVGGRAIQFVVPWSALGGAQGADVSAFVDWSEEGDLLNAASSDLVPDEGRVAVKP